MSSDKYDKGDLFLTFMVGVIGMGMISTMLTCSSHPADVMLAYEKLKANKVPITMSKSGEFWLWNEQAKFCQRVWETDIKTMAETK